MSQYDEWKERFERVWDPHGQGMYRMGSPGQRLAPRFLTWVPESATINEYGSGTGRAVVAIMGHRPDVRVNMVDIAENAMEKEAASLIGDRVTFTLAPLWALPKDFPFADWGYCVDTLMCVPSDRLDEIMAEIRRTCGSLYAQVYDWSDVRLGIDYTSIIQDVAWWHKKFEQFWPTVSAIKSAEHARRYIFLCRGEFQ